MCLTRLSDKVYPKTGICYKVFTKINDGYSPPLWSDWFHPFLLYKTKTDKKNDTLLVESNRTIEYPTGYHSFELLADARFFKRAATGWGYEHLVIVCCTYSALVASGVQTIHYNGIYQTPVVFVSKKLKLMKEVR